MAIKNFKIRTNSKSKILRIGKTNHISSRSRRRIGNLSSNVSKNSLHRNSEANRNSKKSLANLPNVKITSSSTIHKFKEAILSKKPSTTNKIIESRSNLNSTSIRKKRLILNSSGYIDLPDINISTAKQKAKIIKIRKKAFQNFKFYNPNRGLTSSIKRNKSISSDKPQSQYHINSDKSSSFIQTKILETPAGSAKTSILLSPPRLIEKHHAVTKKGHIPIKFDKPNQDSYFVLNQRINETGDKRLIVFAVFDGHGLYGHLVSQFAADFIKNYIQTCVDEELEESEESKRQILRKDSISKEFILQMFEKCSKVIISKFTEDCKNSENEPTSKILKSGTTACIVFVYEGKVICANLGDSKAVLYMNKSYSNLSYIYELSKDHNLQNPTERERIISNDGRIEKYQNRKGVPVGPERVWIKSGGIPGLAMTRSFGDLIAHTVGVTDIPEIKEFSLIQNSLYTCVIASDGLWEHLNTSQVLKVVKGSKSNPEECCKTLLKSSIEEWESKDKMVDDITIIVSNFEYQ